MSKTFAKLIEKHLLPLTFEKLDYHGDDGEYYVANCIFGTYCLNYRSGEWLWSWCFEEYYKEGEPCPAASREDAEAEAWRHYTGILAQAFK